MKLSEIKTAEELMRARYHAYETCDMEFIKESHDPDILMVLIGQSVKNGLENLNG